MRKSNNSVLKDDLKKITKCLQMKEVFNKTSFKDNALVYKPSIKLIRTNNPDLQQLIQK